MTRTLQRFAPLLSIVVVSAASAETREPATKPYHLTLAGVQQLARARAPDVEIATARLGVARAALIGASVLLPYNPELTVGVGPRLSSAPTGLDVSATLLQRLQLGGQRSARLSLAHARLDRARAERDEVLREVLLAASRAFLRVLHADAALDIARDAEQLAKQLLDVARRRLAVGDVGAIDVNVASAARARARALTSTLAARRVRAVGRLRALLGIEPDARVSVSGDLSARRHYRRESLTAGALARPGLRALSAQIRQAQARAREGRSQRWPDVAVFARYGREGDTGQTLVGGVQLFLPVFDRGQGLRATATTQARVVERRLVAARRQAIIEAQTAYRAYEHLDQAARRFGAKVLPRLTANLRLAQQSYRSGAVAIAQLLLLQRETFDARTSYTDLLLRAALAAVDVEATAGILK